MAANITLEQGKTIPDAEGDVMRGLRKLKPDDLPSHKQSLYFHSCPFDIKIIEFGMSLPMGAGMFIRT